MLVLSSYFLLAPVSVQVVSMASSSDIELKVLHADEVVDHVVRTLQTGYYQHSGKRVSEVVVGGSLGQGTTVPGNFDADLVLLSEDITPHEMLDTFGSGARLVHNLQKFLQGQLGVEVKAKVKKELLLVTFSLSSREYDIVVDVDLGFGPLWRDVRDAADFISQLKSKHEHNWEDYRRLFSPAVAKWAMEFIKRQPNRVKELIRRAKRWQKEQWTSDDGWPKSYLIGILMSEACRRWCDEKGWDVKDLHNHMSPTAFDEYVLGVQRIFTNMVIYHRQLCIFNSPWFDDVPNDRYQNPDTKAGQPFVLDPANPFDNLYDSAVKPYAKGRARGDTHNWGAFVEKIGTLDLTRSLHAEPGVDLKVMEVIVGALKNPRKPAQYRWLSQMTINSIHEGGSLHKGTTVPGDVEVDLVILSRNVTVQMVESSVMSGHSRSDMKDIINELQLYLSRSLPQKYRSDFTIKDTLAGSFSFSVTDDNTVVKVDLFIAPYFETLDAAKDTMRDFKKAHEDQWDEFRTLFAPSVAEWQTEYIKKQPGRVKELMKRVKQWKNESKGAKGTPSSYLLEILMLMACRKYCEKKGFLVDDIDVCSVSMDDIATGVEREFVAMVTDYKKLRLKPPQCEGHVWTSGPARWDSCDVDDPCVMDPASGYNNLFISGIKGRDHMEVWREFASKVDSLDLRGQLNPMK